MVWEEKKKKVPGEYHSVSVMVIILLTREGEGEGDECGICRITFGIIVKVITHYLRNTSFPWCVDISILGWNKRSVRC